MRTNTAALALLAAVAIVAACVPGAAPVGTSKAGAASRRRLLVTCGTAQRLASGRCYFCPSGQVANATGTGCRLCESGTAKSPAGANVVNAGCKPVLEGGCGTAQLANGTGVCINCPVGQVTDAGATPPGSLCAFCPAHTFKSPAGSTQANAACLPCGSAQSSTIGVCTFCGVGRVATEAGDACRLCESGTAKSPAGANVVNAVCKPVLEGGCGTAQMANGTGVCINCPAGQVTDAAASPPGSACAFCPGGSAKFPAGTAVNATCLPCGTAQYSTTGVCLTCGTNRVANAAGTGCVSCTDASGPNGGTNKIKWPSTGTSGTCVLNLCSPNPCKNGGSACKMTSASTFRCNCTNTGFGGPTCEIRPVEQLLATANLRWDLYDQSLNQQDAEAFCVGTGGHLVTLDSDEKTGKYASHVQGYLPQRTWIGLWSGGTPTTDRSLYRWYSGAPANTYQKWADGQPDNYLGVQGVCVTPVFSWSPAGPWDDLECTATLPFVCEVKRTVPAALPIAKLAAPGGMRWDVYRTRLAQPEAEAACVTAGGHLVTLDSEEKNRFFVERVQKASLVGESFIWVGLWSGGAPTTDRSAYRWFSGAPADTYANWAGGQPDNWMSSQAVCGAAVGPPAWFQADFGRWDDMFCDSLRPFVCEVKVA